MNELVEIALPLPIDGTFTYTLPPEFQSVSLGRRVLVPFQRRHLTGYVVGFPKDTHLEKLKPVAAVLDSDSILTPELLDLARFMSTQYNCPVGQALQVILPPGLVKQTKRKVFAAARMGNPEDPKQIQFLKRLRASRGLDLLTLVRRDKSAASLIRTMEDQGWIYIQNVLQDQRAVHKTHYSYRLCCEEGAIDDTRGAKRKLLLQFIKESGGEAYEADLKRLSGNVKTVLDALVKKEFLERIVHDGSERIQKGAFDHAPRFRLNEAQSRAIEAISEKAHKDLYHPFLLHGITGSGKTEIYLKAAENALKRGRNVVALVPEISLTPQFVGRFRARFGTEIAVLHSGRSESERLTEWKRIRTGQVRVVIGARSAIFAPLEKIGLIIVDEEHDASYKQEDGLKYSCLEIAKFRAKNSNAILLFGSATPSLETYYSAQKGRVTLLSLPERASGQGLPSVSIIDVRKQVSKYGDKGLFSSEMIEGITKTLQREEQAILFLNRRGFAPVALCPKCGEGLRCRNCSVAMTYHEKGKSYLCHYCDFESPRELTRCLCGQGKLVHIGFGTEKIEEELRFRFPDARIERMDRDTVRKKGAHERLLHRLAEKKIDILVGTQMVTKGLDLPWVTLVGVILADQSLHFPDFRASERTFQLLTQVVGRSGRGEQKGQAYVQTFHPDHYVLKTAAEQDFKSFYETEIRFRKELRYPPFSHLVLLELSGRENSEVRKAAMWMGEQVRKVTSGKELELEALGPAPAPLQKIKNQHRYHILLRGTSAIRLQEFARWLHVESSDKLQDRGVKLLMDLNPQNFL